jgi:hypothetical protein
MSAEGHLLATLPADARPPDTLGMAGVMKLVAPATEPPLDRTGCCRMTSRHELRSHLGRLQPKRIDPEAQKRTGWRRHGILIIAEEDPRLSSPERELVRQLGAKLYGERWEEGR